MSTQPLQVGNIVLLTQDEKRRVDAILDTLHGIRGLKEGHERYVTDEKTRHARMNRLNELGPKRRSLEESKELMHLIVESWYAGKQQYRNGGASNDALGQAMMTTLKGPLMYDLNVAKSLTKIVIDESYITDHDTAGFDVVTGPREELVCPVCDEREKNEREEPRKMYDDLSALYRATVQEKSEAAEESVLWSRVFTEDPKLGDFIMNMVMYNDDLDYESLVNVIFLNYDVRSFDAYKREHIPAMGRSLERHVRYLQSL